MQQVWGNSGDIYEQAVVKTVAAFAEGVGILMPAFCTLPQAFAPLMGTLVSLYLTHVKELGESPDMELLGPVVAKFEEIKGKG
jgi:hypothetical protein